MSPAPHEEPTWLADVREALGRSPRLRGRVVVAASGGADSTALAWALAQLHAGVDSDLELHLVHCDHGQHPLRHAAARAVTALGTRLALPSRTIDLGLPAGASEQQMREARYAALGAAATALGAAVVTTAHHADDLIETVVMRAARGTGARGFAGIPRERPLRAGVRLLRPLLRVRRQDLRALVHAQQLPFVDDPTNAALDRTRNRTRHVVLPELRAARPGFDSLVLRAARRAARSANDAQERATAWLAPHLERAHPTRVQLPALPPAGCVGREVVRLVHLAMTGGAPLTTWLERVLALADKNPGARVDAAIGGRVRTERTRDGLLFVDPSAAVPEHPIPVPVDGSAVQFGGSAWSVSLTPDGTSPAAEHFDAGAAEGPYHLRRPRPGDRIDGRCLRRLCSAAGVPTTDRGRLPLLCARDHRIVWAPGLGVAPSARVRADTTRSVAVEQVVPRVGIDLDLPAY